MDKHFKAAVAGLVTALTITGAAASPAQAAPPQPISDATYSALGDSFAAGLGAGPAQAYPAVLAGGLGSLNFQAVSFGGTTTTVATQVATIPDTTQQITLTVGGNDVGFILKAQQCGLSPAPAACELTEAERALLTNLTSNLSELIGDIHDSYPNAKIYVTGYPLLMQAEQTPDDAGWCVVGTLNDVPTAIEEQKADDMDAAALALNAAIRSSIVGSANSYAKYVDVTAAFDDHGLCGTPSAVDAVTHAAVGAPNPDTWINPVNIDVTMTTAGPSYDFHPLEGPLHPHAAGQQAYATTIQAKGFKS